MVEQTEKAVVIPDKVPRVYVDSFLQVSFGPAVSKIVFANEGDTAVTACLELVIPTENLIKGMKFMNNLFENDKDLRNNLIEHNQNFTEQLRQG